ncbi:hypothetical protein VNI00_000922 [Paramarasmius palmivorus]|uniref:Uncharacterized protein n=1 Tax=Paramarasmius palmivorus TaxID=297713 RepID=A0AAW0E4V8_9AGAR
MSSTLSTDKLVVPTQHETNFLLATSPASAASAGDPEEARIHLDVFQGSGSIPTMPTNVYAAQSSTSEKDIPRSNSPSNAVIVGIIIGGIVLLLLLGLFVWLLLRRRKHKSMSRDSENSHWHMVQSRNGTKENMNINADSGDVIVIQPLSSSRVPAQKVSNTLAQGNPFSDGEEEEDETSTTSHSRRGSSASSIQFARLPNTPISSSFAVTQTGHYIPRHSHRQSKSKDLNWAENQTSLMAVLDSMKKSNRK